MSDRRAFLKSTLALPLAAQDSTPPKKYHVTLYSGGTAVKEWDTSSYSQGEAIIYFEADGKTIQIFGTYCVEEK